MSIPSQTRIALRLSILVIGAIALSSLSTTTSIGADRVNSEEVLASFPDTKWFDSETNSYLPPTATPLHDNELRTNGRTAGPERPWKWSDFLDWFDWFDWDWGSGTGGAAGGSTFGGTLLTYFFYTLLIVGFIAIVAVLTWFLLRDTFPTLTKRGKQQIGEITIDRARIEDLPFEAKPDMGDPLAMAKQFVANGQHDAALVYLYGYMLLALDRRQHIYLQKGKTNRMYLAEIGIPELQQNVKPVQLAFEASFFGKHPVGSERFLEIWATLDSFHELAALQPVAPDESTPLMGVVA